MGRGFIPTSMVIHSGGKIPTVSLGTGTSLFFLRRTEPLLLTPMSENVSRVPTWPHHTSVPGNRPGAYNGTARATNTLQGHVSLERAQRAEAAPECYGNVGCLGPGRSLDPEAGPFAVRCLLIAVPEMVTRHG